MKRWILVKVAAVLAAAFAAGTASGQSDCVVAVIGDSISRAVLADNSIGGLHYGQPQHCWATGYDPRDIVNSHFERINRSNKGGCDYANLAHSGAEADDVWDQAYDAAKEGASYVAILMGGNDICGDKIWHMTPTDTFRRQYERGLWRLRAALPDATIVVAAVPRVTRVYDVGRRDFWCRLKWRTFQWCDNVLRSNSFWRHLADARIIEYNNKLRYLARKYNAIFDQDPYRWQFQRGNLSEIDCFHPDLSGQRDLANMTFPEEMW